MLPMLLLRAFLGIEGQRPKSQSLFRSSALQLPIKGGGALLRSGTMDVMGLFLVECLEVRQRLDLKRTEEEVRKKTRIPSAIARDLVDFLANHGGGRETETFSRTPTSSREGDGVDFPLTDSPAP